MHGDGHSGEASAANETLRGLHSSMRSIAPEPASRVEDGAILRGEARFIADVAPDETLHAVFVRSPFAKAVIRKVDVSAAERCAGVRLVLTGSSVPKDRWPSVNPVLPGMKSIMRPLLAAERVASVGEPVAMVVADSELEARDAAEQIDVEYDPEPALTSPRKAVAGSPIMPGWHSNIAFEHHWTSGDCEAAFLSARYRVKVQLDLPRISAAALETRGVVAQWESSSDQLTVWLPTQSPHRARAELSRILDVPAARVRVINPHVGGAFGAKASLYPEDALIALASIRLRCSVRWHATRNEDLLATSHGRGAEIEAEAAVDERGRFLALRAVLRFPLGYWATFSAAVPAWNAGRILPGPYRVEAVDIHILGVLTNTSPVGILRGAGRPEAAIVMERLMDEAARVLGLDPFEVRALNAIPAGSFPYQTPTGEVLDSGNYPELLSCARDMCGENVRLAQARDSRAGTLVGRGICLYVEPCGRGWESARITRKESGRFIVACGSSSQGQGHRTTFAQIAAGCLCVPISNIEVIEGDSARAPEGIGALASRSTAIGGSAVRAAALRLRELMEFSSKPQAGEIEVTEVYTAPAEAWGSGCCVADVEIDPNTGTLTLLRLISIDDCGEIVSPELFDGQVVGGLAQGIGHALRERIVYDAEGQLLTGSLMDYAMPRADEIPPIYLRTIHTPTPANLLGAKGVGEAGCIAAPAAILNAAYDALKSLGVSQIELPLTSESIWRAMQRASSEGRIE
jgi:carbon-monoxide dehydrogenase large subunit